MKSELLGPFLRKPLFGSHPSYKVLLEVLMVTLCRTSICRMCWSI